MYIMLIHTSKTPSRSPDHTKRPLLANTGRRKTVRTMWNSTTAWNINILSESKVHYHDGVVHSTSLIQASRLSGQGALDVITANVQHYTLVRQITSRDIVSKTDTYLPSKSVPRIHLILIVDTATQESG